MNWKGFLGTALCLFVLNWSVQSIEFELDNLMYETTSDTTVTVISRVAPEKLVVPSSVSYLDKKYVVTAVGDSAFCGNLLKSVSLPNTITKIGNACFRGGRYLKYFEFPTSVRSIGDNVLTNTRSLDTVIFPPKLDYLGNFRVLSTGSSIMVVTLPSTLTQIEPGAFKVMGAFRGTLIIPTSVTAIGDSAFKCIDYNVSSVNIVLPKSIHHIGNQAFYGNIELNINIPDSIQTIGDEAFAFCRFSKLCLPPNVESIGEKAFANCDSFKQVVFPNSLTRIGNYAFSGCDLLDTIVLPQNLLSIGEGVFSSCNSLRRIVFPPNFSKLGKGAFMYCRSLEELELPETLTTIYSNAFYHSGLKSIRIPGSLSTIGEGVFESCDSLKSIYVEHVNPLRVRTTLYTFRRNTSLSECTLYVPVGSKTKYQSAETWRDFSNIVEMSMTGLDNVQSDDPVLLYGAESKNLRVSGLNGSSALVEIVDMNGRIQVRSTLSESETVNLNKLNSGIYLVKLTVNHRCLTRKIMVR